MIKAFNKWHLVGTIIILYALVVIIALFTHQTPEVISMLIDKGSAAIGLFCILILVFA